MIFNKALIFLFLIGLTVHTHSHGNPKRPSPTKTSASTKVKKSGGHKNLAVRTMPSPTAATLAIGHQTALEVGCLNSEIISQLSTILQLQATDWADEQLNALRRHDPESCKPYSAIVTKPMVRNAVAILSTQGPSEHPEVVIHLPNSRDTGFNLLPGNLLAPTESLRQFSSSRLRSDGIDLFEIPPLLQWEVDNIAKRMSSALKLAPTAHHLRISLNVDSTSGEEKVFAIELIETSSGKRIEAAIWLEREDVPGAYFSLQGIDYERHLWQSPVLNAIISRGVGASVTTIKRKVPLKARQKSSPRFATRTFKIKGHHIGIDFAAPAGTPVVSVANGEVVHAGVNGGYGNLIIIDHGEGHQTYYAHLSGFSTAIKPGSQVRRGEEIGFVGSTGFSTGPHLHFEIRKQGRYIDPANTENQLDFWNLHLNEQAKVLERLLRLQLTQLQPPAITPAID